MARNQLLWSIERVVCGNGKEDRSGIQLKPHTFYGCASRCGGHESFYPIRLSSLKLHDTTIKLPYFDEEYPTFLHPTKCNLKTALHDWCLQNPGKVVDISGPGSRREILNSRKYQDRRFGPLLMLSNHGNCAVAAMVNGIDAKLGRESAVKEKEKWQRDRPRIQGLKSIAILLHGLQMNLSVEEIGKVDMPSYREEPFVWLANRSAGIWIVRVVFDGMVDHVVVVNGDRQLVLDSAARFPFQLSEKLLREVGGSNVKNLRVAEVRKLVLQPVTSRKRKRNM